MTEARDSQLLTSDQPYERPAKLLSEVNDPPVEAPLSAKKYLSISRWHSLSNQSSPPDMSQTNFNRF